MADSSGCAESTQKVKASPIWEKRPVPTCLLRLISRDVSHLLPLADKLCSDLGAAELRTLPKLSLAYAQRHWDAKDQEGVHSDSYRCMRLISMLNNAEKKQSLGKEIIYAISCA